MRKLTLILLLITTSLFAQNKIDESEELCIFRNSVNDSIQYVVMPTFVYGQNTSSNQILVKKKGEVFYTEIKTRSDIKKALRSLSQSNYLMKKWKKNKIISIGIVVTGLIGSTITVVTSTSPMISGIPSVIITFIGVSISSALRRKSMIHLLDAIDEFNRLQLKN